MPWDLTIQTHMPWLCIRAGDGMIIILELKSNEELSEYQNCLGNNRYTIHMDCIMSRRTKAFQCLSFSFIMRQERASYYLLYHRDISDILGIFAISRESTKPMHNYGI